VGNGTRGSAPVRFSFNFRHQACEDRKSGSEEERKRNEDKSQNNSDLPLFVTSSLLYREGPCIQAFLNSLQDPFGISVETDDEKHVGTPPFKGASDV
jgi:hypothetical protein